MSDNKTNINWYPGHMVKTKRQIIEDLKLVDVVVELLDARIPISSQNPEIKNIIGNKKRIIVLNKSDLADEIENEKWIRWFKAKNIPAVIVDSNRGQGINNCIRKIQEVMKDEIRKQSEKGRIGKAIRILVLGIPNVGKSSFINRISKRTSAKVGDKPGVTRQKQWIRVDGGIELLDTPGILWPKFENEKIALNLAFTGTIKDEIIEKTEVAYKLLEYLNKNYKEKLKERYKLKDELEKITDIVEIMDIIARKRGAIISGGNIDYEKTSRIILDDFRNGKIGKITIEKAGE